MRWSLMPATRDFDAHAAGWDALNRAHGAHLLLDAAFVGALVRHFATPETLLAVSPSGEGGGFALIERGRLGFANTFQPSQSPLGLILLDPGAAALSRARALIRSIPGWATGLSILQQDPDHTAFRLDGANGSVERVDYIDTGRLRLEGTYETYWRSRSKNLTHNLSRQRRRVAEEGRSLRLRVIEDPALAGACVETYGELEGSGWKATRGTAVSHENVQGAFYRDVLETFLARREGVVYQLELDGRTIASDLCLVRGGTMVILKTAYDATVAGLSPGLLLHQDIVEHCYASGRVRIIEFYGRARDWHAKWTGEFRRMYHVNLYRSSWIARAHRAVRDGMRRFAPSPSS